MRLALTTLAALSLLATCPARAAQHVLTLDPAAARVTFLLVATGHDVEGSFPLTKCEVTFDPETGAASGEIRLDGALGVTGNPKRDKQMREKVLLSPASPAITFRPEKFVGTLPDSGAANVKLEGVANVAGGDHPLTLVAHVERAVDKLKIHSTFDVPFVAWGLDDPSVLFLKVEKIVHVTIDGDARLDDPNARLDAAAPATPAR